MQKRIAVLWKENNIRGSVELTNRGRIVSVDGQQNATDFNIHTGRLELTVEDAMLERGSFATLVTVRCAKPFSFFLRDVRKDRPMFIPEYETAVTEADDARDYAAIREDILKTGRLTKIGRMETEPEESFEAAASHNRNMPCPTWMGLGRDVHLFVVSSASLDDPSRPMDTLQPLLHSTPVRIPELGDRDLEYHYLAGRGAGCRLDVHRRLEEGVLPILNLECRDAEILYRQKIFVTREFTPLQEGTVDGTHYLAADMVCKSPTPRTPEQQEMLDQIQEKELNRPEENVLYLRIIAENTADAPKYAFFRIPQPCVHFIAEWSNFDMSLKDGLDIYNESGRVFLTATLDGQPVKDVEYSVLLAPGETAVLECKLPHRPISEERGRALYATDFDEKLEECRAYWRAKLAKTAKLQLPEKRIEEMMQAGFLHLDMICYGKEPGEPVAPCVGVYTPIGTESTPIIQYIESMGDTALAGRAASYFARKQRKDGFMQNFTCYMSETGLGLFNLAQHYRYCGDKAWLESVRDNIYRGVDYIRRWTEQFKDEKLRKKGYGMISGQVADCAYPFHSYMLNSTTYGGVRNCGEVLKAIDDPRADEILAFAEEYKKNILETLTESFARAPLIPLADGSWCPAISQWPEICGPMCLFAQGGKAYSHAMFVECSENGCYDIMYGIVEPKSDFGSFIIKAVTELTALENTVFSQAYYSVHPYVHLLRGETGSFLKEFYNNMSAMADRETYSFWEHQTHVSSHKTHEESWFLMRCRWMLFLEQQDSLTLFGGVPRAWLKDGGIISADGVNSLFGRLSFCLKSETAAGRVSVRVKAEPRDGRFPAVLRVRVPHPEGKKAVSVSRGSYDPEKEWVEITDFRGELELQLQF